jgi:hypothetical protein
MSTVRTDAEPMPLPGYVPTGEGAHAECPDHGTRMMWDAAHGWFYCPAGPDVVNPHVGDETLVPRDIYLEHDEAWRVVDGALYVDQYAAEDEA